MKKNKGITLIALVITIIIVLILVAVTIMFAIDGGIISKAEELPLKNDMAKYMEELELAKADYSAQKEGENLLISSVWNYEEIINYIPDFDKKYEGILGIVDTKLTLKDTDIDKYNQCANELKIPIISVQAKIKFQINGLGTIEGATIGEEIQTKEGKIYNLIAKTENVDIETGETITSNFKGWYKGEQLLSENKEISIKAEDGAIYTAIFETEPSLIYYMDNDEEKIKISTAESLGGNGYKFDTTITKVYIGKCCNKLNYEAFNGCSNITEVYLPENLTYVAIRSFQGCPKLESIDIPNGVTFIGESAFNGCKTIKVTRIPDNIEVLGPYVFNNCGSLPSVIYYGKTMEEFKNIKCIAYNGAEWTPIVSVGLKGKTIRCIDGDLKL